TRLGEAGIETAQQYAWELRIDALEGFLERVAAPSRLDLAALDAGDDSAARSEGLTGGAAAMPPRTL
ncbi:MAG: hypothetical protein JWM60_71, partial [Solirubrobacterales bacterium]|nr:hypothetical protein [Solirubrobacterales bacterium]